MQDCSKRPTICLVSGSGANPGGGLADARDEESEYRADDAKLGCHEPETFRWKPEKASPFVRSLLNNRSVMSDPECHQTRYHGINKTHGGLAGQTDSPVDQVSHHDRSQAAGDDACRR